MDFTIKAKVTDDGSAMTLEIPFESIVQRPGGKQALQIIYAG